MNETKMSLYHEINRLNRLGFNKSQIGRKVGMNRDTVRKYLTMEVEDMIEWNQSLQTRQKKLDDHETVIVDWLKEHADLSAAQIEDWLLEEYPNLEVGSSTIRTFVQDVRDRYVLPKQRQPRQYEAVPEVEMGEQIQVDWGETWQETVTKEKVKLYFICFVLAHSRYKYVSWLDRPFRTQDTIRCHEQAFRFFGGRTNEIVYDQDHLIAIQENAGDLLLTQEFHAYQQARGFEIYLCRAADPESKGKIERVVGYVKSNFAKNRRYNGLDDWNAKCLAWLERTGNHKVHGTTKKRPDSVFLLEKAHLKPVSSLNNQAVLFDASITAKVGKDNTIRFKGNRYSVPLGTYQSVGTNDILLTVRGQELMILNPLSGEAIAQHSLSLEKGKLIKKKNHGRDRSKTIQKYREAMIDLFDDRNSATQFIDQVIAGHKRYAQDQFLVLEKAILHYPEERELALATCIKKHLWSANDFRDISVYLAGQKALPAQSATSLNRLDVSEPPTPTIHVSTRSIHEYTSYLGGEST